MPRRKLLTPTKVLTTALPAEVHEKLTNFLRSSRTGQVPQGAYQRFLSERIEEFFRKLEGQGDNLLKEMTSDTGSNDAN